MIAILAYLFVALRRLDYPFALEWLEGNSLAEVHRVLAGQSLYPAPTAGYVPDGYPPLYFAVSAAAARVLGPSYLTLRLVSLVSSLACFALLGRLVQRETASIAAGTAAAGLLAATYFVTDTWFDVARVDSLFLALSIGALYAARYMRGTGGAVTAGVLLAAAALTKQTGLAECAAVTAVLLAGPRRRLGWVAALAEVVVLGVSTLVLALTSGGWYLFYVYRLMSEHSLTGSSFGWFWTALARRSAWPRPPPCSPRAGCRWCCWPAAPRWRSRATPPWCTAAAASTTCCPHTSRWRCWPAWLSAARQAWRAAAAGVLVLAQTALLLSALHPAQVIPSAADRAVGERLVAGIRALGGTVAVPTDPGLSLLAGQSPVAHQDAAFDVLRATNQAAIASFKRSVSAALAAQRFSAVITDSPGWPLGYRPALGRYYQRCPQPLLAGVPAAVFEPVAGIAGRPRSSGFPGAAARARPPSAR